MGNIINLKVGISPDQKFNSSRHSGKVKYFEIFRNPTFTVNGVGEELGCIPQYHNQEIPRPINENSTPPHALIDS